MPTRASRVATSLMSVRPASKMTRTARRFSNIGAVKIADDAPLNVGLRDLPSQCLAWSVVQCRSDSIEVFRRVPGEVGALREVLTEKAVGVVVGAALPGPCGSQK
jgi:hypothetical protein